MDRTAYYLIQNTNGVETINFQRMFDNCCIGNNTEALLNKLWNYVNFYDDVTEEQELKFLEMLKSFVNVKLDKYTLFKNKIVDRLAFEYAVEVLEDTKKHEKTETVTWIDHAGFFYFVFGIEEENLNKLIRNKIFRIDSRFFERMGIEAPGVFRRVMIKVRKAFDVR